MARALEEIEPAALDLIEASTEYRLVLALAAYDASGTAIEPPPGRTAELAGSTRPLRMALTIREDLPQLFDGCVPTDRQIAAQKRGQR